MSLLIFQVYELHAHSIFPMSTRSSSSPSLAAATGHDIVALLNDPFLMFGDVVFV
jgi:hypothetical protein